MGSIWTMEDAGNSLVAVVEAAGNGAPQRVTVEGAEAVVAAFRLSRCRSPSGGACSFDSRNDMPDLLIATTALEHAPAVVTCNVRHFAPTGAKLLNF